MHSFFNLREERMPLQYPYTYKRLNPSAEYAGRPVSLLPMAWKPICCRLHILTKRSMTRAMLSCVNISSKDRNKGCCRLMFSVRSIHSPPSSFDDLIIPCMAFPVKENIEFRNSLPSRVFSLPLTRSYCQSL